METSTQNFRFDKLFVSQDHHVDTTAQEAGSCLTGYFFELKLDALQGVSHVPTM